VAAETLRVLVRAGGGLSLRCSARDGDWTRSISRARFSLDFMIRYHLYRISFPLLALAE